MSYRLSGLSLVLEDVVVFDPSRLVLTLEHNEYKSERLQLETIWMVLNRKFGFAELATHIIGVMYQRESYSLGLSLMEWTVTTLEKRKAEYKRIGIVLIEKAYQESDLLLLETTRHFVTQVVELLSRRHILPQAQSIRVCPQGEDIFPYASLLIGLLVLIPRCSITFYQDSETRREWSSTLKDALKHAGILAEDSSLKLLDVAIRSRSLALEVRGPSSSSSSCVMM